MKKNTIILIIMAMSYLCMGQNYMETPASEIDLSAIEPTDFDTFWLFKEGCAAPQLNLAYTYMDTFRVIYRKPFSQYLLGNYYCGHIIVIDSVKKLSPFVCAMNDSIVYVYVKFYVANKYYSPYNKEIYFSPLSSDIEYDAKNGFAYLKRLRQETDTIYRRVIPICILATTDELEHLQNNADDILLRVYDECDSIIFAPQLFIKDYNIDILLDKRQIAKIKILRYRKFYYDLYKKEIPD